MAKASTFPILLLGGVTTSGTLSTLTVNTATTITGVLSTAVSSALVIASSNSTTPGKLTLSGNNTLGSTSGGLITVNSGAILNIQNAKLKGLWKNEPIPECDVTEAYWAE